MTKKIKALAAIIICFGALILALPACKSCNKSDKTAAVIDSAAVTKPSDFRPMNTTNLPHADSTLIPVLAKVLDEAFDASAKKDYGKLAGYIIFKGPDSIRFGYDVFNAKNSYERGVVRITGEVFNKWNRGIEARDYGRVFELEQPDGRKMIVLEVIFVSKKTLDRKFFGFLPVKDAYKIVDVTSYI